MFIYTIRLVWEAWVKNLTLWRLFWDVLNWYQGWKLISKKNYDSALEFDQLLGWFNSFSTSLGIPIGGSNHKFVIGSLYLRLFSRRNRYLFCLWRQSKVNYNLALNDILVYHLSFLKMPKYVLKKNHLDSNDFSFARNIEEGKISPKWEDKCVQSKVQREFGRMCL